MKPIRVAVVTNVLPHYRAASYERLIRRDDLEVRVYCQTGIPGMNLDVVHDRFADHVTLVSSMCLRREWLGWQWLRWRRLLSSFDVPFIQGNPRVVSNVLVACLAVLLGKPVIIRGQAHTANADARTERLRLWWWPWFDNLFVHTDGEVRWLGDRGFQRHHIVGINDGLDQGRQRERPGHGGPLRGDGQRRGWRAMTKHAWTMADTGGPGPPGPESAARSPADPCLPTRSSRDARCDPWLFYGCADGGFRKTKNTDVGRSFSKRLVGWYRCDHKGRRQRSRSTKTTAREL